MTCRELIDFLMDYLEGELSEAQRQAFEHHLSRCPDCVAYLAAYKDTIQLGKQAFAEQDGDVPEEVPEELVRAILASRRIEGDSTR